MRLTRQLRYPVHRQQVGGRCFGQSVQTPRDLQQYLWRSMSDSGRLHSINNLQNHGVWPTAAEKCISNFSSRLEHSCFQVLLSYSSTRRGQDFSSSPETGLSPSERPLPLLSLSCTYVPHASRNSVISSGEATIVSMRNLSTKKFCRARRMI